MKKRYIILAKVKNKQGDCIGIASNSYTKSHPLQKHFAKLAGQPNKIFLHAEILALIRASANPHAKIHSVPSLYHDEAFAWFSGEASKFPT